MNAKEMFEKLGFKRYVFDYITAIVYEKNSYENGHEGIRFENHEVRISDSLTMDKLKAIYQQCKELGWLDE